ncbi:MAG: ATP-binding protein [Myxococcota bacterium]
MSLDVQSALLGTMVTIAVMAGVLLRRRGRRTDRLFAYLCVNLIAWLVPEALRRLTGAGAAERLALAAGLLLPLALVRLFVELIPGTALRGRRLRAALYPTSLVLVLVALSPLGEVPGVRIAAGAFAALSVLWATWVLMQGSNSDAKVDMTRRRYVAFGAAGVAVLIGLTELAGAAAVGHLAVMVYVFFLSQVILRERLLDLNELLGRMAVLGILVVLFASVSALLVSIGSGPASRLFNATVAIVVLLTVYEPLKDRLERKMAELFFRERDRFAHSIDGLRQRLQQLPLEPRTMSRTMVDALYASRRATHVAVYLVDGGGQSFSLAAYQGPEPAPRVSAGALGDLFQAIHETFNPLLTDRLPGEADEDQLLESMQSVSADALFPFWSQDEVLGFMTLRDDRSPEPFSTAEIERLQRLAETAATLVWNSQLSARVRERERLAAIGAMAAGLAHEIRNPLGAIKGAAEYLDPARFPDPHEAEFLQVIIEETDRLNGVVSQFLDYARPFQPVLQDTELNEIVRRTLRLVEVETRGRTPIQAELEDALPVIRADPAQLKQVLLNLVLNAVDATREGQPIHVRTSRMGDRVRLQVRDEGRGIPPAELSQIFIPFFTTKQSGTGLGLAVCQRIVSAHGGEIQAASNPGEGASFTITLPVAGPESTPREREPDMRVASS